MKALFFLFILLTAFVHSSTAQPYPIGKITPTWIDASRGNRNVPVEVYYPAVTAGTNVAVASGTFPVMVIGHGFSMGVDAYYNFRDFFVPRGFIIVLVNTEIGPIPFPDHAAFGADLNFAVNQMQALNNNTSSVFFGRVKNKSAIMGHSMGGGCSFLAASTGNPYITTLLGFAPAETNPSAISAASNISIPALLFYGSKDAVTPPANHVIPMYNNLSSSCKVMVSITDGSHCRFANNNVTCNFGESTSCIGCTFISHADHHARTFAIMEPWLNFFLKEDCGQWVAFEQSLDNTTGTSYVRSCNYSLPIAVATAMGSTTVCNGDSVMIAGGGTGYAQYLWSNGASTINISVTQSGNYSLFVTDHYNCRDTSNSITVEVDGPQIPVLNTTDTLKACENDSIYLSVVDPQATVAYVWNTGDTIDQILLSQTGYYFVMAMDSNGCTAYSDTIAFYILPLPTAPHITLQNDTLFATASADSFQWFFDGIPISNSNVNVLVPTASGRYSVVVTDDNGCTSPPADFYYYLTISDSLTTANTWHLFPNPVNDVLVVSVSEKNTQPLHISLHDVNGGEKSVLITSQGNSWLVDIAALPPAIYYLRISTFNGIHYQRIFKLN